MPRARTGTVVWHAASRSYRARITVTAPNGSTTRPWYSLDTADEEVAKKKLAALVVAAAKHDPATLTRFEAYAMAWLGARKDRGVAQAQSERGWLTNHILPVLGAMFLATFSAG